MSTLRVNVTLEREPGVATAHIRLGNRWAKATLRNVSNVQLKQIAMGDNEVLLSLWKEAQTRGEAWVKFGPKDPFVKLGNCPLCPRPWRVIDRQPTDPYLAVMEGRTVVDADVAIVLRADSEVAMLIVDAVNATEEWREVRRRLELAAAGAERAFVVADARRTLLERYYCEVCAERDHLRDIVARLCDELESHYHEPVSMDDPCIVREARAAIGEEV